MFMGGINMAISYFRGKFTDKNGKTVTKEVTSTTKSSTQLGRELKSAMSNKGYKYSQGSYGNKAK